MKNIKQDIIEKIITVIPHFRKNIIRPMELLSQNDDLSVVQTHALFTLFNSLEPLNMMMLSKELGISKQQLTKVIAILVKLNFIERYRLNDNRREVFLSLTEQGLAKIDILKDQLHNNINQKLNILNDEELQKLDEALVFIMSILERIN